MKMDRLSSKPIRMPRALILPLVCFNIQVVCAAKLRGFQSNLVAGIPPVARSGLSMVSWGKRLYVYGGWSWAGSAGYWPDLQAFDLDSMEWVDLSASSVGQVPEGRYNMGVAEARGRLFVFGGWSSAEEFGRDLFVFDPSSMRWTELSGSTSGVTPAGRRSMGMAAVGGKVFVFGGSVSRRNGDLANDLHVLDVEELSWTELRGSGSTTPRAREAHKMVALDDQLYVFGGWSGQEYLNELHAWDPASHAWTALSDGIAGTHPLPRAHPGVAAAHGSIYVYGGWTGRGFLNDVHVFSRDSMAWTLLSAAASGTPPVGTWQMGFAAAGEKLFVFGGDATTLAEGSFFETNDFRVFELSTATWTPVQHAASSSEPQPRDNLGMAAVGGKVFVFGGFSIGAGGGRHLNDLHVLDPWSATWTGLSGSATGVPPAERNGMGMEAVGERLLVFGGNGLRELLSDLFAFDPASMQWTELHSFASGSPPSSRRDMGTAEVGGLLYVFGGSSGALDSSSQRFLNDMHAYDPGMNTWTALVSVTGVAPRKRSAMGMAAAGGIIYVFGGRTSRDTFRNDLYAFDPARREWAELTASVSGTPPSRRRSMGMVESGGRLYIFGGFTYDGGFSENGLYLNDLFCFDPGSMRWTELSAAIAGAQTDPRMSMGMVAVQGRVYIFGGFTSSGVFDVELGELAVYMLPRAIHLTSLDLLGVDLSFVYDLDTVVMDASGDFALGHHVELCRGALPCQLTIEGAHGAPLRILPGGRLSCDKLNGCTLLALSSVNLACDGLLPAAPLAVSSGAHASLTSSHFSSCSSLSHGGVLVLSARSTANVSLCSFQNIHSNQSGGAIFAERAELAIAHSAFRRCSAGVHGGAVLSSGRTLVVNSSFEDTVAGGEGGALFSMLGAAASIAASAFANCRSTLGGGGITSLGPLQLDACTFSGCVSAGPGGAVRAAESDDALSPAAAAVSVVRSHWMRCSSQQDGGAISCQRGRLAVSNSTFVSNAAREDGGSISVKNGTLEVDTSVFESNSAGNMGGALSLRGGGLSIARSSLVGNEAGGLGGGAMHVLDARAELDGLAAHSNRAPQGGGGVLLWQGAQPPAIGKWDGWLCGAACPPGTVLGSSSAGACDKCPPGTYKEHAGVGSCASCPEGSYAAAAGASSCVACPLHSTAPARSTARQNCTCNAGYPGESGGPCTACAAGMYAGGQESSAAAGSSAAEVCLCTVGYSGPDGGPCTACDAGTFKNVSGSGTCFSCPLGTFTAEEGAGECTACPGGTYQNRSDARTARSCVACPHGAASSPGSTELVDCSCTPGFTGPDGGLCSVCAAGWFKASSGSEPCAECPPGSYTQPGSAICSTCPWGQWLNSSSPASTFCASCPANTIVSTTGRQSIVSSCSAATSDDIPWCLSVLEVPADTSNVLLTISIEQTDFDTRDEDIASVLVDGQAVDFSPISFVYYEYSGYSYYSGDYDSVGDVDAYDTSSCGSFLTIVDQLPVSPVRDSNGVGSVRVFVNTTEYVNSDPCSGLYLNAKVELSFMGVRGASAVTDCVCMAGYEGPDGGPCTACAPGKYKESDGPGACGECEGGTYKAGSGAGSCGACVAGGYSGAGSSSCSACLGEGSSSAAGSEVCTCNAGYSGPAGGPCTACGAGTFKESPGSGACAECPPGSYADEAGSIGCSMCDLGTYSDSSASIVCASCPARTGSSNLAVEQNTFSACSSSSPGEPCSTLIEVPAETFDFLLTISIEQTDFDTRDEDIASVLVDGQAVDFSPISFVYYEIFGYSYYSGDYAYDGDFDSYDTSSCGSFLTIVNQLPVSPVRDSSGVGSVRVFVNTTEYVNSDPCSGLYLNAKVELSFMGVQGASAVTDCVCMAGYEGPDGGPCTACAPGKYKESDGPGACGECEGGTYKAGSGAGSCGACVAGGYSGAGASSCSACPAGSSSAAGSSVEEDCVCTAGYSGPAGGPCAACAAGWFKASSGSEPCAECPPGSYADEAGFAVCSTCPSGQWLNSSSPAFAGCASCPAGSWFDISAGARTTVWRSCTSGTSALGAPSCSTMLQVPPSTADVQLRIKVEQTDFDSRDETIASVLVNGETVDYDPILYAYLWDFWWVLSSADYPAYMDQDDDDWSDCGHFVTIVDQLPVSPVRDSNGVGSVDVDIRTTSFVDNYPCSGLYLNARVEVSFTGVQGASAVTDCVCMAGYEGPDGGPCTACAPGKYKESDGPGACGECEGGTYKAGSGAGSCGACVAGGYSGAGASSCSACPAGSSSAAGSSVEEDCVCTAGYSGPAGGPCAACAAGWFKASSGSEPCAECPTGTRKMEPGPGACLGCLAGTFAAKGSANCSACPEHSFAPPHSTTEVNCSCIAGYSGQEEGLCSACDAGWFKASSGSGPCVECPAGSFTPTVAQAVCAACAAGSYAAAGSSSCSSCPPHTSSAPQSSSLANCSCSAGYTGKHGGPCTACPEGTYKDDVSAACAACPPNSVSAPASTGRHQCLCGGGFTGSVEGICVPCNASVDGCNRARYGECVASDYRRLAVQGPAVAFAGMDFEARVLKLDFYSQRVQSDSSSIIIVDAQAEELEILGPRFVGMQSGASRFAIAVKPAFGRVDALQGTTELLGEAALVFRGTDAEAELGGEMRSERLLLANLALGHAVCPRGSVLALDAASPAGTRAGACAACKPGSYSLQALVGPGPDPACLECPEGGDCADGGAHVRFEVGEWREEGGMYVLASCPAGHALINRAEGSAEFSHNMQQCQKCTVGLEYIVDPNRHRCQECPVGASCDGSGLVGKVEGSLWVEELVSGIFVLASCPTGYGVLNSSADGAFVQRLQQCVPCAAGSQCTSAASCQVCTPCAAGTFKDIAGSHRCGPCPPDTYAAAAGATSANDCQACPLNSNTRGRRGQVTILACECDERFYVVRSAQQVQCVACPRGAVCPDASCALRTANQTCEGASGSEAIAGQWARESEGSLFVLESCEAGYSAVTSADGTASGAWDHASQQCRKCSEETEYIVDPNRDACHKCPQGLQCYGNGDFTPRVPGSTWSVNGSLFLLTGCPAGYSVLSEDAGGFSAEAQRCAECGAGEECAAPPCTRCSPCRPGHFKSFVGTSECAACPADTFREAPGAAELAACQPCPGESSTRGEPGRVSRHACECKPGYYPHRTASALKCYQCPLGAQCLDGAALATRGQLDATGQVEWKTWGADTEPGRLWLQRCPPGFRMENKTGYEQQECQRVPQGMFIASNADSSYQFQRCPDNMVCLNGGIPTANPVSAELQLLGLSLPGAWSAADTAAVKQSARASLADSALELEVTAVCLAAADGGACFDLTTQRRAEPEQQAGSVTVSFQAASPTMSSQELAALLGGAAFSEGVAASLAEGGMALQGAVATPQVPAQAEGVGTYKLVGSRLVLTDCPVGFLIFNASVESQRCDKCPGNKYSVDPTDGCVGGVCEVRECLACAEGARCNGGSHFEPAVANSTWILVRSQRQYSVRRLAACPAGFVLVRQAEEARAHLDECLPCPYGTYSVVPPTWDPPAMVADTVLQAPALCQECEVGAVCEGGALVVPRAHFWRLPAAQQADPARVEIYECPKNACEEGGECSEGRDAESVLCGMCLEGHALAGTRCTLCGDAASKGFQAFALSLLSLLFLAAWWFASWRPFFQREDKPEDWRDPAELPPWELLKLRVSLFIKTSGKTVSAYFKVFISFWQIMSTFESTYNTEWPKAVEDMWEFGRALSLNVLNFPGPNCLTSSIGYLGRLQIITIIPAAVCFLLYIPTLLLILLGERTAQTFRYKNTSDHFWHACLFWLSVQGFKCREVGGKLLLEIDLSEDCPWSNLASGTFLWSCAASLLYPIGIPVFMYWQLVVQGIPQLAAKKHEEAVLHEMLVRYKEHMAGTIYRELALNIGGGQSHHDERLCMSRVRYMYDDACGESARTALTRARFERYLHSVGIVGAEEDMQDVIAQLEVDAHGIISWDAFALTLMRIVTKENHFMAATSIADIHDEALADLCCFRWRRLAAASGAGAEELARLAGSTRSLPASFYGRSDAKRRSDAHPRASLGSQRGSVAAPGSQRGSVAAPPGGSVDASLVAATSTGPRRMLPAAGADDGLSEASSEEGTRKGPSARQSSLSGMRKPSRLGRDAARREMLDYLLDQGTRLLFKGAISIPVIVWNAASTEERDAIDKLGFVFENYVVRHYHYELLEMARKFVMTGFIIFLWPASMEQIAIAVLVTVVSMVYVIQAMPFANHRIGSLQAAMLSTLSATLFYGLLLSADSLRREQLQGEEDTVYHTVGSTIVLVLLSTIIFLVPPLTVLWEHRKAIYKHCAPQELVRRRRRTAGSDAQGRQSSFDAENIRRSIERHLSLVPEPAPEPEEPEEPEGREERGEGEEQEEGAEREADKGVGAAGGRGAARDSAAGSGWQAVEVEEPAQWPAAGVPAQGQRGHGAKSSTEDPGTNGANGAEEDIHISLPDIKAFLTFSDSVEAGAGESLLRV